MALLLAGLIADVADAQQKGGRRGGFFGGGNTLVSIAGREAVQNELGLDEAAKSKVEAIVEKYNTEAREQTQGIFAGGFQNLTAEERQKALEKITEVNRTLVAKHAPALKEALKPEQFTRLQQITWQAAGASALTEADVVKELSITKEQQDKIAALIREYGDKQRGLRGGGADFQEIAARTRELNQQRDKLATEVLTKEQQDKFAQLKGKPFDVSQLQGGGRRRGGNQN
jgi:Spy/CpxP family protein refolding chaperone